MTFHPARREAELWTKLVDERNATLGVGRRTRSLASTPTAAVLLADGRLVVAGRDDDRRTTLEVWTLGDGDQRLVPAEGGEPPRWRVTTPDVVRVGRPLGDASASDAPPGSTEGDVLRLGIHAMIEIVGSPDPGDRAVRVLAQLGSGDVVRLDPTTGGLELVAMRTDLLPPPGVFASELLMPWNSATFLDSRALGHAYVFRRTDEAICDVVEPIYPWSVLLDEDRDGTIDRLLVLRNGDDVDARGIQGPPPDGPR